MPESTPVSSAITLDGSKGEGGGQILRNAISYATLLQKELTIAGIRAKRSKPGLKAQHMVGLQLAAHICGGQLLGNELHSSQITYKPPSPARTTDEDATGTTKMGCSSGSSVPRLFRGEIATAGSICLLLQAALPCALFHTFPTTLVLKGGTNASMAPQWDYWTHVFWPTVRKQCVLSTDTVTTNVKRRGFFPKGGGEVHVHTQPLVSPLPPMQLTDRGSVSSVHIRSYHAGSLPRRLALECAEEAETMVKQHLPDCPIHVEIVTERDCLGSGLGILAVAKTTTDCRLAGSAISVPRMPAKTVGRNAALELIQAIQEGGCVDEWLQDQLVIFCCLGHGVSEIITGSLTLHTQTAISIAETMTGAVFEVSKLDQSVTDAATSDSSYGQDGRISGRHLIRCQGIGFHR